MKTNTSVRLFLVGFSLLTFLSFVGVTSGTLAWYAYSTRATLAYKGVSVYNAEQLQIGIQDAAQVQNRKIKLSDEELAEHNCARDSNNIVWAKFGAGIDSTVISAYLSGAAIIPENYTSSLTPVTTLDRTLNPVVNPGDNPLPLYKAPSAGVNNTTIAAETTSYIQIPFVFRTVDNNNEYVGGSSIWLRKTEAKVISTNKTDITKSLRIFTEDPENTTRRYLINPSDSNQTGSTTVAGLLDLNHDGYYDHSATDSYTDQKELLYGSYSYTTGTDHIEYGEKLAEDTALDNFNNLSDTTHGANSFYAKHRKDIRTITNKDNIVLGQAQYYGMGSMAPSLNPSTGGFSGGTPITSTAADGDKIARLNVTIFLEGWDHSVIDTALECQFYLGLTFEIDRV